MEKQVNEKKSLFLLICLPIIGLIISAAFIVSICLMAASHIQQMLFFPQFIIFAFLFLIAYPYIMIFISNLYFKKICKKSWEGWFKLSSEPDYDYVFTIVSIMPSAFLAIEAAIFCYANDLPDIFVTSALLSIFVIFFNYKKMLIKFFGCETEKGWL